MKLHSPEFERGLKRAVKKTIRASPELRREQRRVRRRPANVKLVWFWRLAMSFGLAGIACAIQNATGHLATALAGLGIYLAAAACFRIQNLRYRLYLSPELPALNILPISTGAIFRWQILKFFRESVYLFIDLAACLGTLAYVCHFAPWQWAATVLYVFVAWFYLLGLAAFCVLRYPRWPFQILIGGMMVLAMVLIFTEAFTKMLFLRLLDQSALELTVLLPSAWPLASFDFLAHGQNAWLLALLLPVAFMIAHLPPWIGHLRNTIMYRELVWQQSPDLLPGESSRPLAQPENKRAVGPTEIEEIISSRAFLALPAKPLAGLLERQLWNWLTPREKALADFAYPAGPTMSRVWKKIYVVFLATIPLTLVVGSFDRPAELLPLGLGVFLVFVFTLATMAEHGRVFSRVWASGGNIPLYASYGVGFNELNRFFFKCTVVQLPLALPPFVLLGGFVAWCFHWPMGPGLFAGFKLAGLMLAARFILNVFAFSSGSNDTARFNPGAIVLILGAVIITVAFIGLAAAALLVPFVVTSLLLWVGAFVSAWMGLWGYGCYYRFARFDLMAVPK